jgi:phage anti-repressor protein
MIDIKYSPKGTPYVWASSLYEKLEIKISFNNWIKQIIDFGYEERVDYAKVTQKGQNEAGEDIVISDYAIELEMAKHISIVQKTETGKKMRNYLISLDKKVSEGLLLTHQQVSALFEICKVLGYFSVQDFLEKEHYNVFNQPKTWWDYRAKLFGYSAAELKGMLEKMNKTYQSQRQALMHLKKYELIKRAAVDLFIAMGKNAEYAKNAAMFVEKIAMEIKPEIYDDRNTSIDFKTSQQKETIDKIKTVKEDKQLFEKFN